MHEFKVNRVITLKLEGKETIIYVAGEVFRQCKKLILNIPITEITALNAIRSIDEIIEKKELNLDRMEYELSSESEFWAHCSNLQIWAEYNYDTRLLHKNLAFPLLKRLSKVGDKEAKRVFKEEIAERFEKGNFIVQLFLLEDNYLDYLKNEELDVLVDNLKIEKCNELSHKILNLSSMDDQRSLIYKKLSSLNTLFVKLLNLSEGEALLEYLKYSNINQLKLLLRDHNSHFYDNLIISLKNYELNLGWNPFYFLEHLFIKIVKSCKKFLKYKIIKTLKKKNTKNLMILIKLQWLNYLDQKDFKKIIKEPKINFIDQILILIKKKVETIDLDINCYDLIFILILLEKIKRECGKSEILKIKKALKNDRENFRIYLQHIKENLELYELKNSRKKKIIINELYNTLY